MDNHHENINTYSFIDRRTLLRGALASAALITVPETLTSCTTPPEFDARKVAENISVERKMISPEINLATNGNWRMIGVKQSREGLVVNPVNAMIEDRDSGEYMNDPPIAIFGTHLEVPEKWELSASISNTEGFAMQCYGKLPLIRDDYRIENESIRMQLNKSELHVESWQNADEVLYDVHFPVLPTNNSKRDIRLQCNGVHLTISVDDVAVGKIDERGIFSSGKLWLGFDTATRATNVTDLHISGKGEIAAVDTTTIRVPKNTRGLQTLASAKNQSLRIGATVAPGPLAENPLYDAIALGGNYGVVTLENAMKPVHLMPHPDTPTFQEADAVIELARKHTIDIHGHTLVFGESLPRWIRELPTETKADKQTVEDVMTRYIATVMNHFKGKVKTWDVINEPLAPFENDQPDWRDHLWYQAMGKDYIEIALRAARQADPNALLFINENALENNNDAGNRNRWRMLMDAIVLPMKEKGLIDGVGIQGHVAELPRDAIDASTITSHLRELEMHGLLGRISEIDVDTNSQSERAEQYANTLQACLLAKNCISFTMWGVMSGYENKGLVWDKGGRPLPAVKKMQEILER
jgi:endo-1,4-beta-xylanase